MKKATQSQSNKRRESITRSSSSKRGESGQTRPDGQKRVDCATNRNCICFYNIYSIVLILKQFKFRNKPAKL